MAGDSNTRARAEMFELLLEDGPVMLTCITRVSWGGMVSKVDRLLFHLAEHRSKEKTAKEFGISVDNVTEIVQLTGERELEGIS